MGTKNEKAMSPEPQDAMAVGAMVETTDPAPAPVEKRKARAGYVWCRVEGCAVSIAGKTYQEGAEVEASVEDALSVPQFLIPLD